MLPCIPLAKIVVHVEGSQRADRKSGLHYDLLHTLPVLLSQLIRSWTAWVSKHFDFYQDSVKEVAALQIAIQSLIAVVVVVIIITIIVTVIIVVVVVVVVIVDIIVIIDIVIFVAAAALGIVLIGVIFLWRYTIFAIVLSSFRRFWMQ